MRKNSEAKNSRAEKAVLHTQKCKELYGKEIAYSIENSDIADYTDEIQNTQIIGNVSTNIQLVAKDTVSALFENVENTENSKTALLNFASYKNAGGGFLGGAVAQEEALCAESFLYNVLSSEKIMSAHYEPNRKKLNNGTYGNNHIYSPNIRFFRGEQTVVSDVITCAAPNRSMAIRYNQSLFPELDRAMQERIDTVLYSAYRHSVKNLILGAYGCGVFRNDPVFVAETFRNYLENKYRNVFENVIFAVPDTKSKNYTAFSKVFG